MVCGLATATDIARWTPQGRKRVGDARELLEDGRRR